MNRSLRLGLIGCGNMGSYYAYNFSRMPDASIVICCDPSAEKLHSFQQKWNIPHGSTKWQDFFDSDILQLDGIINCSSDKLHDPVFSACASAQIPLFTEKPFAVNLETISRLNRQQLAQWPFMINFSKRTLPVIQNALLRTSQGEIGKIHKLEMHYRQGWLQNHDFGDWHSNSAWFWRLSKNLSHHGVIGDLASHLLDIAVLFGGSVTDVCCRSRTLPKEPELLDDEQLDSADEAVCILNHSDGVFSLVHVSRAVPGEKDNLCLLISGSRGTLKISAEEKTTSFNRYTIDTGQWQQISSEGKAVRNHALFAEQLQSGQVQSTPYSGIPGLAAAVYNEILISAAEKSIRQGSLIEVADIIQDYDLEDCL